ncbi:MAG: hypothetical protein DYG99_01450 [Bacteroidetes bacterium CHB5]|nr:hypothetical protein [Bacteroidetes bacterium CHB5]
MIPFAARSFDLIVYEFFTVIIVKSVRWYHLTAGVKHKSEMGNSFILAACFLSDQIIGIV